MFTFPIAHLNAAGGTVNTGAIILDGSTQYLSATSANWSNLDNATSELTLECWFNLDTRDDCTLLQLGYLTTNQGGIRFNFNKSLSNDELQFWYDTSGANYTPEEQSGGIWATATWDHVAVTSKVNGGNRETKFYRNGSQMGSTQTDAHTDDIAYDSGDTLYIGCISSGSGMLDGMIDDFRYWSVAKTEAEIAASYEEELVGNESNLLMYLKLNSSVTDEVGNVTLTANGSPSYETSDLPF